MTTATQRSQEKPNLRKRVSATTAEPRLCERVSTAEAEKPRAAPKKPRSTRKRPNFGTFTTPPPIQPSGGSPSKETAPAAPEAASRRPPEQQAVIARRAILPAALASAMGMDQHIESTGYRHYRDVLLKDAGNPTNPVEIMLLEQLAVCHLRAAQLQGHAGQAAGME